VAVGNRETLAIPPKPEREMSLPLATRFEDEISKIIIGRKEIIRLMLVALLSEGHVLLEGNPGLGKTTLAKSFAQTIGGDFKRIQMTPDILPADILGTYVLDQKKSEFRLRKGPIFGNVILVDELNRATPKAQAALLETMQEKQATFEGTTIDLPRPFMVLATQGYAGTAGTFPLSEFQSDRFAFSARMEYPSIEERIQIISRINEIQSQTCSKILSPDEIASGVETVRNIAMADSIKRYVVSFADYVNDSKLVRIEPSVRASIALARGSKVLAFLDGRDYVIPDDVKFLAPYVFRHRIFLTPEALVDEVNPEKLVSDMVEHVPVPKV
jgi:MoxR-like ATPase